MKLKTLAAKESKLTQNDHNIRLIYPKSVVQAAELRGGDRLKHVVVVLGKRKLIVSERVNDLSQEHQELLELFKS